MRFRLPRPSARPTRAAGAETVPAVAAPAAIRADEPGTGERDTGESSAAESGDVELRIAGMTCAGCATTIRDGLLQLPGVASAGVSPVTHRAALRPDGTVPPEDLEMLAEAAIAGLGYRVVGER